MTKDDMSQSDYDPEKSVSNNFKIASKHALKTREIAWNILIEVTKVF